MLLTAGTLFLACLWTIDAGLFQRWRKVAAETTTSPPPDHSGVVAPVGHSQFPLVLSRGQSPDPHTGHPCSRQCLLKGCERWFLPRHFQDSYCSTECRIAARRWRRWRAARTYRATANGKQRHREQARRSRERKRLRSALHEPAPLTPEVEPSPSTVEADVPDPIDPPTSVGTLRVGQRPAEIPENSLLWPCSRPGCYVLFCRSLRSPQRAFCSCSCRQALRRVRQRRARLRIRQRHGRPRRRSRHLALP